MGRHPSRRHATPEEAPIGRRIRQRRRELGMTQSALAGPDYTKSFISQLEGGFADPSLDTLRYLARRLQTSLSGIAGDMQDQRLAALEGLVAWARDLAASRHAPLARRALELAADLAATGGWTLQRADAMLALAELELESGRLERAAVVLQELDAFVAGLGARTLARRDLVVGSLAMRRGDAATAAAMFREALGRLRSPARQPDLTVRLLLAYATALVQRGDVRQARRRLDVAARLAARYKLGALLARAWLGLGLLAYGQDAMAEARETLERARQTARSAGDRRTELESLIHLGRVHLAMGEASVALEAAQEATTLAQGTGDDSATARAAAVLGRALLALGRADDALPVLEGALQRLGTEDSAQELAEAADALGRYHQARNEQERATHYFEIALGASRVGRLHAGRALLSIA
ncbi:MAG: tetratricopeptide repeat protein [Armatimonadota bacterium]|nr:tetratricopeptide repeat protein [Armatimonadota bacterium]